MGNVFEAGVKLCRNEGPLLEKLHFIKLANGILESYPEISASSGLIKKQQVWLAAV